MNLKEYDFSFKEKYDIQDFLKITKILRAPGGCPWDREQTHYSLVKPMLEEAYEAVDAIEKESTEKLTEELGDVLLQVIFHSIIGEEEGELSFNDVTDRCARKMLSRHTHIFGDAHAENSAEALNNWDEAKLKEKGFKTLREDLNDIPGCFPALMRAGKAAKKIRKGDGVYSCDEKISDGVGALSEEVSLDNEDTVGAVLYEVCRIAEKNGVDPELALKRFTDKVISEN